VSDDGPARASAPPNDDQPLRVAMKKVATALKGANVPFALSGGYASWARGGPEPLHDVDFVLLADDVPHGLQVLDAAGLRVVEPPEDWLVKVYDGDALVDLIFRPAERPVTREQLDAANEVRVDCDFGRLFPHVRALREQVDWPALHEVVGHSAFARSFLALCGELGIAES
jgi:hypothetical protein